MNFRATANVRTAALALAATATLGLVAEGQQPSFRAATELVVVDVSVVGKDGTPVRGLEEADFAVTIDGRPRPVRSLKYIGEDAAAGSADAVRPGRVSSNSVGAAGRLALILVDEGSIGFAGMRAAAQSIDRLLAGFGPTDKVGLASLPGPRMRVDFTLDREAIVEAVERIPAGGGATVLSDAISVAVWEAFEIDRGNEELFSQVVTRECPPSHPETRRLCARSLEMEARRVVIEERNRTAEFVSGIRALLRALAEVDAPKLVIVLSEGFADPDAGREMAACGPLASAARATIFAMRLDRAMFDLSSRQGPAFLLASPDEKMWSTSSLQALTGAARGATLDILGSADEPFARLAREISGYYLVGVEGDPDDRDGRAQRIEVKVARKGVTVRARREVAVRKVEKDEGKLLARALSAPTISSDVPLRVATFNMADDDPGKVRVLVVADVDREQASEAKALVGVLFTDESGKTAGDLGQRMTLPRDESGALSLMLSTSLAPGDYTMKLAVAREGRVGSVEHRLDASLEQPGPPLPAAVQLGEVVVADSPSPMGLRPALDGRVSGDDVVSFLQIGAAPSASTGLSLFFDIVKEQSGAALASAVGAVDAKPKGRTRLARAALDARLLPPGDYGVRVTVVADGAKAASLYTPFRLERPVAADAAPNTAPPVGTGGAAARFAGAEVLDAMVLGPFLEEVARLSPPDSRPALELARSGRFDEAARLVEPGHPGDPAPPFLRGLALFARGELQPASNEFRAAIAEQPELLVGAFFLGACYAAGGKDGQAIGAWQTSLAALGRYPAVYRFLGDALMRTGQAGRARQLLSDAANRWPGDETLRAQSVGASVEAGRYVEALDEADRLIAEEPGDPSILFLAMRSAFQALLEGADVDRALLLERLERYRDLYAAAGGLQQALVQEWVSFARGGQ